MCGYKRRNDVWQAHVLRSLRARSLRMTVGTMFAHLDWLCYLLDIFLLDFPDVYSARAMLTGACICVQAEKLTEVADVPCGSMQDLKCRSVDECLSHLY